MRPCSNRPSGKPCPCDPPRRRRRPAPARGRLHRPDRAPCRGSRERFLASEVVQDAFLRNLQVLAESTSRLSNRIRATEPGVPWAEIQSFRNRLAHGCLAILDIVWEVVRQDLPELDAAVRRMRSRERHG